MNYENPWLYNDEPFLEEHIGDHIGFVYLITEKETGKKYIGKKILFNKVSKPPLKGKKKRRISVKYSDWQTYYGSSKELCDLVEAQGKDSFTRVILHLCKSKGEMSYRESEEIFKRNALLSPEYWNSWISCRIQANTLKGVTPLT